jgi:hypothetical protein
VDHTGCHQLNRVLTHNNNVRVFYRKITCSEKCQPYLKYDEDDKEADEIWDSIDNHMDSRRRWGCTSCMHWIPRRMP